MKKRIKDKIVNIDNVDMFVKAMEDIHRVSLAANANQIPEAEDAATANSLISAYNKIYAKLPFPLYCIEADIKYAVVYKLLRSKFGLDLPALISDGLVIDFSDTSIHFKGRGYVFEPRRGIIPDTHINLNAYKNDVAYAEFNWVYRCISDNRSTVDFYKEFCKEIVDSCKDSLTLKTELSNILNFMPIPAEQSLKENCITDFTRHKQYYIDIFVDTKMTAHKADLMRQNNVNRRITEERVYDYTVFAKECKDKRLNGTDYTKLYKVDYPGLAGVFEKIVGHGVMTDSLGAINFRGVCINDLVLFEIYGRVYTCTFSTYTKPVLICRDAKLHAVGKNGIFLRLTSNLPSGVTQDSYYCYDTTKRQAKLCSLQFTKGA